MHAVRAQLNLDRHTFVIAHRRVQRLVPVVFGANDVVALLSAYFRVPTVYTFEQPIAFVDVFDDHSRPYRVKDIEIRHPSPLHLVPRRRKALDTSRHAGSCTHLLGEASQFAHDTAQRRALQGHEVAIV